MGSLVSVVIPAFNAERWIDETLRSVRSQTYAELEIVVVDDGSIDQTPQIVEHHAQNDRRLRLIQQQQTGVASARNRGILETRGEFIAPVDADDLWAPTKIERQMDRFREMGERAGLVYTRFALINANSEIIYFDKKAVVEGAALDAMCLYNVVGNGSAALMRRSAVREAGGYDPSLRAAQAQGCEDYQLYFKIAERYDFGLVDDWLTGYREAPGNMSSDLRQMIRSRDLCVQEFRERHPSLRRRFDKGRARLLRFNLARSLRSGDKRLAADIFREMMRSNPAASVGSLGVLAVNAVRSAGRRVINDRPSATGRRFPIGDVPGFLPQF